MEPTGEQLITFYRLVRRSVLLSSYIAFVEMGEDEKLYVYVGRYDNPTVRILFSIRPDGHLDNESDNDV